MMELMLWVEYKKMQSTGVVCSVAGKQSLQEQSLCQHAHSLDSKI